MESVSGSASIIVRMVVLVTLHCNNHIAIVTILGITVGSIESYSMSHTVWLIQYLGDQCEIRDCTRPDTCLHGECQLDSTCKCFEGWSGDRCDFNICDMVQCPEFSTCRNSTTEPDGYICECRKGFAQTRDINQSYFQYSISAIYCSKLAIYCSINILAIYCHHFFNIYIDIAARSKPNIDIDIDIGNINILICIPGCCIGLKVDGLLLNSPGQFSKYRTLVETFLGWKT